VIQPLANRVLVKPDPAPDVTASGLVIPDNAIAAKNFEMSGTVVTVGKGPASAHRVREAMIARFHALIDQVEEQQPSSCVCATLRRRVNEWGMALVDLSEVHPGDHVAFPYTVGTVIEVDGERHLLMNEDQIVAILNTHEAAA